MQTTPEVKDIFVIVSLLIFVVGLIIALSITLYDYHLEQQQLDKCLQENIQRKDRLKYCQHVIFNS